MEKVKIKDLVLTQPGVTVSMHKGVQPRCVYVMWYLFKRLPKAFAFVNAIAFY